LTEGDIVVLSVSSLFDAGGSACECMHATVCTHTVTQTHSLHNGYSNVSLTVGTTHLEGPKNPNGFNLGIYVFVYVYKVYMLGGRLRSGTCCSFPRTYFSFRKRKTKYANVKKSNPYPFELYGLSIKCNVIKAIIIITILGAFCAVGKTNIL